MCLGKLTCIGSGRVVCRRRVKLWSQVDLSSKPNSAVHESWNLWYATGQSKMRTESCYSLPGPFSGVPLLEVPARFNVRVSSASCPISVLLAPWVRAYTSTFQFFKQAVIPLLPQSHFTSCSLLPKCILHSTSHLASTGEHPAIYRGPLPWSKFCYCTTLYGTHYFSCILDKDTYEVLW